MRRLKRWITVVCLLMAALTAAAWWHSRSTWHNIYFRIGGELWVFQDGRGSIGIEIFHDWPHPPRFHRQGGPLDPSSSVTPMYWFGAGQPTRWRHGDFAGEHGSLDVLLRDDGSVDLDSALVPLFQHFRAIIKTRRWARVRFQSVEFPYWSVVAALFVAPASLALQNSFRQILRRSRRFCGRCTSCGYGVRESMSICPECGTAVDASAYANAQLAPPGERVRAGWAAFLTRWSPRWGIAFAVLSVLAIIAALENDSGWAMALFLWIALSFAVVAIAYLTGEPRLLLKRRDGSQPLWSWGLLWPYRLFSLLALWLYRITHRRDRACAQVLPGVWFSRRLTVREAQEMSVAWWAVLDLAAEFSRVPMQSEHYRSLRMLDGAAPPIEALHDAVAWINDQAQRGPVLVHCALGHGRSGSVVATWMLINGQTTDLSDAFVRLRQLRPGMHLSRAQAVRVLDARDAYLHRERRESHATKSDALRY